MLIEIVRTEARTDCFLLTRTGRGTVVWRSRRSALATTASKHPLDVTFAALLSLGICRLKHPIVSKRGPTDEFLGR